MQNLTQITNFLLGFMLGLTIQLIAQIIDQHLINKRGADDNDN